MCVSGVAGALPAASAERKRCSPSGRAWGQAAEPKGSRQWPGGSALPAGTPPYIAPSRAASGGKMAKGVKSLWSLVAVTPSGENTGSSPDMQAEAQASGQRRTEGAHVCAKLGARRPALGTGCGFYQRRPGLLRAGFLKCETGVKNRRGAWRGQGAGWAGPRDGGRRGTREPGASIAV